MHYLKYTFRNIIKNKGISVIKIVSLTIGFLSLLFLIHYIQFELSYDKGFNGKDSIFRITYTKKDNNVTTIQSATTPSRLGVIIRDEIPEIKYVSRLLTEKTLVYINVEKKFNNQLLLWVDDNFLDVFGINTISGNKNEALKRPHTAVVTRSMATRYFGNEDPIGKTIYVNEGFPLEITAIVNDLPQNTHFDFDFLTNIKTAQEYNWANSEGSWRLSSWYTYIKTSDNIKPELINNKLKVLVNNHLELEENQKVEFSLQPVTDIHLKSNLTREISVNSNIKTLYILLLVMVGIILITWLNYFNLVFANVFNKDFKDWQIRKMQGAQNKDAIKQNLSSNLLIHVLSILFSLALYLLLKSYFERFTEKHIEFSGYTWKIIVLLLGLSIIGTTISSFIQTLFISIFKKDNSLKPAYFKNNKFLSTQKILGILQFTASITFIILLVGFMKQVKFMRNKDLGFSLNNTLVLTAPNSMNNNNSKPSKYEYLKNELKQKGIISDMASSVFVPGKDIRIRERIVGKDEKSVSAQFFVNAADNHFLNIYNHKLLAGRNFLENETEGANIIVNEKFIDLLNFENYSDAINQQVWINQTNRLVTIIGIVQNSHYEGLSNNIAPMILYYDAHPEDFGYYSANVSSENIMQSMKTIESLWDKLYPNDPLVYFFSDENFNTQYDGLNKYIKVFSMFTTIAIIISCIGLIGFSFLTMHKRNKEIGVRKVNGAKNIEILSMLNKDYIIWISSAFIISSPIAWYFLEKWLQNFAFRTKISWWIFILSGVITLIITIVTVSWQSWQSARKNPVEALRYE